MWISILAAFMAVLIVVYYAASGTGGSPYLRYVGKPVSPTIVQQVTGVSDSTLTAVGKPSGVSPPTSITGPPLTSGGKPEFLYIGGDYCPFCALERWSIVVALSHFGTFHGMDYMLSEDPPEINPDTPTFTFSNTTFTSNYITFVGVEEFGRGADHAVIQPLTADQQSLISQFDTCSSSGQSGGIPFVDIANKYAVNCGSQFSLSGIAGANWTQVASVLNNPSSGTAQLIDGAANTLITAICSVDGAQPSSVCTQPYATVTLAYSPAGSSVTSLVAAPPSRAYP
jgi:hypothetical protein